MRRSVPEGVGVPDSDLVWWTEDTEYLQWRIPRAGWVVKRSAASLVEVAMRREGVPKPPWKYYYEARNQVAYRLRTQRPSSGGPVPRYLTSRVRLWRAFRSVVKLMGRSLWIERTERLPKARMVLMGAVDGLRGRSGLRVALGAADRARATRKEDDE